MFSSCFKNGILYALAIDLAFRVFISVIHSIEISFVFNKTGKWTLETISPAPTMPTESSLLLGFMLILYILSIKF